MSSPLRALVLACQLALIVVLAAAILRDGVTLGHLLGAAAAALPLALTLRGLAAGRREVQRWLAVALIPYAGALSVEVVARAGGATLLGAGLLIAVLELGLLLALIRRPAHPSAARE
jgi:hypothetical protein